MNLFLFISALVNGLAALVAGIAVYWQKRDSLINQTFAVFCFAIAFWAFGSFWPIVSNNSELTLLSFRVLHVGAFFLAIANFHFITAILGIAEQQKKWIRLGYAIAILLLPLIGTKLFISGVAPEENFTLWLEPGIFYHVWIAIWLAYFAATFHLIGKFLQTSEGVKKQQVHYIYLGEIVTFAALTMNFLPTYDLTVPIYFNILIAGQIGAFAYAILRFRHLDIQLSWLGIIQKIVALLISLGLGLGISYVVFFRKESLPVLALFPVVSLATYFTLAGFFGSRTFYRLLGIPHIDDFTRAAANFYERKLFYSNLAELENSAQNIFAKMLGISSARIILLQKDNRQILQPLLDYFEKTQAEQLLLNEFFPDQEIDLDPILQLGMLCFPLRGENRKLIGFFFLGEKPHRNNYSPKELEILRAAAAHISLSLKILNYNADLQAEVARKTEQLETSLEKLQKADEDKDRFFSMTSHDLRTPLTIIKGYEDFLHSEKFGKLSPKQKEFLERIAASTESMLELVNSILDFRKLEAGRMEFNLEPTDWEKLARDIVSDFQIKCAEKSIELNLLIAKNLPKQITTDADKLKRILLNLLMNAFKFTPEKGLITLTVQPAGDKNFLEFTVADTGVGIAKKDFVLLFQEFRQIQNPQQHGGTGLGLSIVKKIVERLGGRIRVESEVGHGSNFIFTLPINSKK
ncbi:MAG: ATP-binding protein [Patescibacteria group bacterium]